MLSDLGLPEKRTYLSALRGRGLIAVDVEIDDPTHPLNLIRVIVDVNDGQQELLIVHVLVRLPRFPIHPG
ncbi:hypothetical protein MLD38_034423 [Melastoma candidum]|uniref:Uncharacterized protein n=1 Tax=Melastoma candidum TaxID=119954 RepID=A0ACB9M9N8_9MYRT|nr:hypothetical protein MLD38_034423 [Melastoma candidum]